MTEREQVWNKIKQKVISERIDYNEIEFIAVLNKLIVYQSPVTSNSIDDYELTKTVLSKSVSLVEEHLLTFQPFIENPEKYLGLLRDVSRGINAQFIFHRKDRITCAEIDDAIGFYKSFTYLHSSLKPETEMNEAIAYLENIKQKFISSSKNIEKKKENRNYAEVTIVWQEKDSILKQMSALFFDKGYTTSKLAFYNVMKNNNTTKWKGDFEYLAFLLHELAHKEPPAFTISKGKGRFSTAMKRFGEDSQILSNKNYHHTLVNRIKKGTTKTNAATKEKVDALIKSYFPIIQK